MKKLVVALVLAGVLGAAAYPAEAQNRLRMASVFPSKLTQLGSMGKHLEDRLDAISDGALQIEFLEPGEAVPALELFEAVKSGRVDAGWATPGYWQRKEPALALFSAVPFGPRTPEYASWLFNAGGEALMQDIYDKHGIHSMICGVVAPEASGWFREPVTSLEQLKGMKLRFFGLGARVLERLGAETQLLNLEDTLGALESGDLDGAEFSMPAIDRELGIQKHAKHYYFPGWHQQSTMLELMINEGRWNGLSDTEKAQIETVCRANVTFGMAEGEAMQARALESLERDGVTVHRWPDSALKQLEVTWQEVADELSENDRSFNKAWKSLEAFRAQYATWGRMGYLAGP